MGPFDWIAHEAGQVAVTTSLTDPMHDFNSNALATFNLLEAVRKYSPEAKNCICFHEQSLWKIVRFRS